MSIPYWRKPITLTRQTALTLIQRIVPGITDADLIQTMGNIDNNGAIAFQADSNPDNPQAGMTIICANDWFWRNGRIALTISNALTPETINLYFDPQTLERDESQEQCRRSEEQKSLFAEWQECYGGGGV